MIFFLPILIVSPEKLLVQSDRQEKSGVANQYLALQDCRLFRFKLDTRKPDACRCYEKSE